MTLLLLIASAASVSFAYRLGRRAERMHRNRRLDFVLERSYVNRTHHGRCHERL